MLKIKYLTVILTKHVHDLHAEICIKLMKELKESINK